MKLVIRSQNSKVPLKFGNGLVILSHILLRISSRVLPAVRASHIVTSSIYVLGHPSETCLFLGVNIHTRKCYDGLSRNKTDSPHTVAVDMIGELFFANLLSEFEEKKIAVREVRIRFWTWAWEACNYRWVRHARLWRGGEWRISIINWFIRFWLPKWNTKTVNMLGSSPTDLWIGRVCFRGGKTQISGKLPSFSRTFYPSHSSNLPFFRWVVWSTKSRIRKPDSQILTLDKMAAISPTIYSDEFSWI